MMSTTVAIVEDDRGLREVLAQIIAEASGLECQGTYCQAEEALIAIPANPPDVILMDINLPGMDGVECVRRLAEKAPRTQIIMLTVYKDTDSIFNALAAGAVGYLNKPVRAGQLIEAIREVISGGSPMSSAIARKVVQAFRAPAPHKPEGLAEREAEVLELLARGYQCKEVAQKLGVSYSTVRTYVARIYEKLQVNSRAEAIARYLGHHD